MIEDIKSFMKDIEMLNKKLEAQDKIINTQALEIARLKEQLENDIDRYEDTISYQLGFDKGKEQLQQENKQLKEQLEYLRSNEYLNQVKWERTFNEELVKDLQQKIDKAIEEINYMITNADITEISAIKLKQILGDKE